MLATSALGIVVTGAPGATRPRYEIRQLQSGFSKQYDLFIQAMTQFQAQPQSSQTSYYQIAGIHGVPRQNYDGVGKCASCSADGYCTHDSILFLGWHRAYLTLFEQELVSIAKTIAAKYPSSTRASYQAAASALRLPYWDWAAKPSSGNTLPTQLTATSVTINTVSGRKTVKNPLYSYHFSSTSNLVYSPFVNWPNTLRYPTSNAASATSNEQKAITAFNNIRGSLQDQLYQIFSTCDTFPEVGLDTASTGTNKCSNSLEGIHNTVHTTSGGPASSSATGGHMTYLGIAAFDPLFWLHHCNIDRLFAMWQAVHPNSYGGSQNAPAATWTIAKGSNQNTNSPLTPFHRDSSGNFLTTALVRNWRNFHYTYPEFAHSDGSAASIQKYINNLYGPNAGATAGSSKRRRDLLDDVSDPLVANNGSLFQYVANIETPRYALNGSYNVFLFNGNPESEDPSEWLLDSNLIGPMGVLAKADTTMSSNDLLAAGSIPLTRTLTDIVSGGALSALTEAIVVPYLKQNLQWRIQGPNGDAIDPTTIPEFDLTIYASTATQPTGDELPTWSEFIALDDITKDLAAGAEPSSSASAAPESASATSTAASSTPTSTTSAAASTTTTPSARKLRRRAERAGIWY